MWPRIVQVFLDEHEALLERMQAAGKLDLERIIITSPVLAVVTYSLIDACRIIVAHELNHVAQARRVLEAPGFPA